jgi:hypothetical protein
MATITRTVKYAPCGDCGEVIPRDDMHSMNVKVYDPEDTREVRIPVRLCGDCRTHWMGELRDMQWDNSQMETREVEVNVDVDDGFDLIAATG